MIKTVNASNTTFTIDNTNGAVKIVTIGIGGAEEFVCFFSHDEVRELIDAFSTLLPASTMAPLYVLRDFNNAPSATFSTEKAAIEHAAEEAAKRCEAVSVFKRVASVRAVKIETYKTEVER